MAKKHKRPVRRSHGLAGTKAHHGKVGYSDYKASYLSLEHADSARTCREKVRWLSRAFAYMRLAEDHLRESGARSATAAAAEEAENVLRQITNSPCVKKGK